jgi:hypothetical protein
VRYGTAYWDLNAEAVIFETAIRALAEGNSLRSTARIVQVDKDTACDGWTGRPNIVGKSCSICGGICLSLSANWTSCGALSIPRRPTWS